MKGQHYWFIAFGSIVCCVDTNGSPGDDVNNENSALGKAPQRVAVLIKFWVYFTPKCGSWSHHLTCFNHVLTLANEIECNSFSFVFTTKWLGMLTISAIRKTDFLIIIIF